MTTLPGFAAPKGGAYAAKNVAPTRVATDPRMRADRLCVIGECRRPLPRVAILHEDPFCSTPCCRLYYGAAQ